MSVLVAIFLPYILIAVGIVFLIYLINNLADTLRFYNRDNCRAKIGGYNFADSKLTANILSTQGTKIVGKKDSNFEVVRNLYKKTFKSVDIKFKDKEIEIDNTYYDSFKKYNIVCKCEPIVFKFPEPKNRKIVFYVFPETVLAFAEGKICKVFIGAYTSKLFNFSCEPVIHQSKAVVYEKSKNQIEYYYKFNPVSDAEIVHCEWTVKNIDGSRSFRGGLLPENNPLKFDLRYMRIKFKIGQLSATVEYSNYNSSKRFEEEYKTYFSI